MRNLTTIVTKLKLPQILREVLPTDMNVSAVNPALQLRPEAFKAVDAFAAGGGVFASGVIDGDVTIAGLRNVLIAAKFIGADGCTGQDVRNDNRLHGALGAARYDAGNEIAATLFHADDAGFVALVARPFARHAATDQGFVNLDNRTSAAQRGVTINRSHILADFMAHTPSRFVGDAKLALDFLGSNTVTGGAELEHDKEPVAQRGASAVKWGASGRIDLRTAPLASIGAAIVDAVEARFLTTLIAVMTLAKAGAHQVVKAAFLSGEAGLKLAKSGGFRAHA